MQADEIIANLHMIPFHTLGRMARGRRVLIFQDVLLKFFHGLQCIASEFWNDMKGICVPIQLAFAGFIAKGRP
jgi:hypothetical protein